MGRGTARAMRVRFVIAARVALKTQLSMLAPDEHDSAASPNLRRDHSMWRFTN